MIVYSLSELLDDTNETESNEVLRAYVDEDGDLNLLQREDYIMIPGDLVDKVLRMIRAAWFERDGTDDL